MDEQRDDPLVSPTGAADESAPTRKPSSLGLRSWLQTWWGGPLFVGACLLIYLIVFQTLPAIVIIVSYFVTGGSFEALNSEEAVAEVMIDGLWFLISWMTAMSVLTLGILKKLRCLAPAPRPTVSFGRMAIWATGLSALCLGGSIGLGWILEALDWAPKEQAFLVDSMKQQHPLAILGLIVILTPIGEELFFRRLLFSQFLASNGRLAAYALTMLIFAVVHFNFSALILYAWIGFCTALAYDRTGSIKAAVLVHIVNNFFAALPFLLEGQS